MITKSLHTDTNKDDKTAEWFDNLIASISTHQLQLKTKTAPAELEDLYDKLINGDLKDILLANKANATKYFISNLVYEYMSFISEVSPKKVAFHFANSDVLSWIEISDDREDIEDQLLLAEAKVNAKYAPYGVSIVSTVIEESDNCKVPPHYKLLATE